MRGFGEVIVEGLRRYTAKEDSGSVNIRNTAVYGLAA